MGADARHVERDGRRVRQCANEGVADEHVVDQFLAALVDGGSSCPAAPFGSRCLTVAAGRLVGSSEPAGASRF